MTAHAEQPLDLEIGNRREPHVAGVPDGVPDLGRVRSERVRRCRVVDREVLDRERRRKQAIDADVHPGPDPQPDVEPRAAAFDPLLGDLLGDDRSGVVTRSRVGRHLEGERDVDAGARLDGVLRRAQFDPGAEVRRCLLLAQQREAAVASVERVRRVDRERRPLVAEV